MKLPKLAAWLAATLRVPRLLWEYGGGGGAEAGVWPPNPGAEPPRPKMA